MTARDHIAKFAAVLVVAAAFIGFVLLAGETGSDVMWTLAIVVVAVGLYLLPTIVAFRRHVSSPWSVVVINVMLGWTLVGWAVALAMAARDPKPSAQ